MKKFAVISNVILLLWYFLAMIGVKLGDLYLVEGSFKDEWIFLIIPIVTFTLFLLFQNVGKIVHIIWLSMWLLTQLLSHEWYIFFQNGLMGRRENKIEYFKNCIKLVNSDGFYLPDVYHIVLHIFIITALVATILCKRKIKAKV